MSDKIQVNYTIGPSKNSATWPSPDKKPSFIDIPKVDVINADSGIHAVLQVTKHIARGLYKLVSMNVSVYSCTFVISANKSRDELLWKNRFPWDREGGL
ncbi:hypothetical protein FOC1_g10003969 [Fusarium oxysporum f. sp. cubense race 1]|uniref:Uncharacterized protein n=1 Tax=Fusarium oxysporum f. sp. cubense (strain race 1) TaxID=1229664 RepID=N4U979_FUSC1|nr:hypothetical protein FOC1_g10003969 [Fusarium oxysporum f. sp. cubense race 1]